MKVKKNLFYSILVMLFLVGCSEESANSSVSSVNGAGSDTIAAPVITETEEVAKEIKHSDVAGAVGADSISGPQK